MNRPEENGSQAADSESAENGEEHDGSEKYKVPKDIFDFYEKMDRDEDDETELQTVSFEINQHSLEKLQKRSVTSVQYCQSNYHSYNSCVCMCVCLPSCDCTLSAAKVTCRIQCSIVFCCGWKLSWGRVGWMDTVDGK